MIFDALALFDEDKALTTAATSYGTGEIDLFAAGSPAAVGLGGAIGGPLLHDIGRGRPIYFFGQVTDTFESLGAATLVVSLLNYATTTSPATGPTVMATTDTLALATLVEGYRFRLQAPPFGYTKRYLSTRYVVGTTDFTAGTITCGLTYQYEPHADIMG